MKRVILAAMAVVLLSGCEVATLFCDDDFDCSNNDYAHNATSASPPAAPSADMAR